MINRLKFLIFDRMTAREYIQYLQLLPHPEGGHYAETYRSGNKFCFPGFEGERVLGTSIYFLLEKASIQPCTASKAMNYGISNDGAAWRSSKETPMGQKK